MRIFNVKAPRKVKAPKKPTWLEADMRKAVELIKNNQISYRKAAKQFNIPKTTLQLKVKGFKGRPATLEKNGPVGRKFSIPYDEEEKLAKNLKTMSKWGFGLGKAEVLEMVKIFVVCNKIQTQFKDDKPGKGWFISFCKRHKLSLKTPELVESSRARQSNDPFIIKNFYKMLSSTINELGLNSKPELIYNCDESGFKNDPTSSKVVTAKGLPAKRITGGNARSTTTVLACVNAAGQKQAPLILHKGQKLWKHMIGEAEYPGTSYSVSDNGWMTEKVFTIWFKEEFLPKLQDKPVLLLYDGHLSHISLDLVQMAIEAEVTILKLPPHTSHILQPLDVCVFRGVKSKWDSMVAEWTRHNYGKILPKSIFSNIFGKVWTDVKPEVIKKGFEKTGIYPFNENKIPDSTFDPEKLTRYNLMKQADTPITAEISSVHAATNIAAIIVTHDPPISAENSTTNAPTTSAHALTAITIPTTEQTNDNNFRAEIGADFAVQNALNVSKSFEEILLETVSPVTNDGNKRKRVRIDDAEIITSESYLEKLEKLEREKKEAIEKKSKIKIDKENSRKLKMLSKANSQKSKASKKKVGIDTFPKKKFEKRNKF